MTVSERLRSCWGPTWLARRSPVKQASETTSIAFEWTTKRLLWCPFQCVEWWRPHQSLQPSFMALSSRAIFLFRWIRLSVTRKTHLEQFYGSVIISLFTVCHVKNLRVFVSHPGVFHGKINGFIQFADFWVYYTACSFKRKSCEL